MLHLRVFALILAMFVCACGANYRASGSRGSVPARSKVFIQSTSEDADKGIRQAIAAELAMRGHQVVAHSAPGALILNYHDDWKWDIIMYLWALDIQLAEPSGKILGTGDFSHHGIHHYPNNRHVVRDIFAEMDKKGIFAH